MDFPEYTDARYADRRVPSQQIRYAHTQVHIHTSYLNFALQSYHLQGETSKRKINTSNHVHPQTWIKQVPFIVGRSEEHTSELQSLMRISYAVFCLKKKKKITPNTTIL